MALGRPEPRARQPLPARVLGRPAPAHRHRPRARARARADRARRAGVRARRVDPGRRRQPARGPAGRARACVPLHRARPVGRAAHLRPRRGDVPRQDRRDRDAPTTSTSAPAHPYTQALLSAVPVPDPQRGRSAAAHRARGRRARARSTRRRGCRFRTRCWKAQQICAEEEPALIDRGQGHPVACHFAIVKPLQISAAGAGSGTNTARRYTPNRRRRIDVKEVLRTMAARSSVADGSRSSLRRRFVRVGRLRALPAGPPAAGGVRIDYTNGRTTYLSLSRLFRPYSWGGCAPRVLDATFTEDGASGRARPAVGPGRVGGTSSQATRFCV